MLGGSVDFDVPVEVAYAYLADPRNRPEWQSSLRSVELLDDGEPRVGMRWRDHTTAGIVPDMEITAMAPDEAWSEVGHWHGVSAVLTLLFQRTPRGCTVDILFRVTGRGPLWLLGWAVTVAGAPAVRADVRRAAKILAGRRA